MINNFEVNERFMGETVFGPYYDYSVVNTSTGSTIQCGLTERLAGILAVTLNKYSESPNLEECLKGKIWISENRKVFVKFKNGNSSRLKTALMRTFQYNYDISGTMSRITVRATSISQADKEAAKTLNKLTFGGLLQSRLVSASQYIEG